MEQIGPSLQIPPHFHYLTKNTGWLMKIKVQYAFNFFEGTAIRWQLVSYKSPECTICGYAFLLWKSETQDMKSEVQNGPQAQNFSLIYKKSGVSAQRANINCSVKNFWYIKTINNSIDR